MSRRFNYRILFSKSVPVELPYGKESDRKHQKKPIGKVSPRLLETFKKKTPAVTVMIQRRTLWE